MSYPNPMSCKFLILELKLKMTTANQICRIDWSFFLHDNRHPRKDEWMNEWKTSVSCLVIIEPFTKLTFSKIEASKQVIRKVL